MKRLLLALALLSTTAHAAEAPGLAQKEAGNAAFNAGRHDEALREYSAAASLGNAAAMFNLGLMHMEGQGIPKDAKQGYDWFLKSAQGGYVPAMMNVGYFLQTGLPGVAIDKAAAGEWLLKAAQGGDLKANAQLALRDLSPDPAYTPPSPAPASFDEAFYRGLAATEKGDYAAAIKDWTYTALVANETSSMKNLGLFHYKGLGVKADPREARRWWVKAALFGQAEAMYCLGVLYNYGEGVQRDLTAAKRWYTLARDAGWKDQSVKALAALEKDLLMDNAVTAYNAGDFAAAAQGFEQAAAGGNTQAMLNRGQMAAMGKGAAVDGALAATWYRKAADAREIAGMLALSDLYRSGNGVAKSDTEAVNWLRRAQALTKDPVERGAFEWKMSEILNAGRTDTFKAVERAAQGGNDAAMLKLGYFYKGGLEGAPKDPERAVQWIEGAAYAGNRTAVSSLVMMYRGDIGNEAYENSKKLAQWEKYSGALRAAESERKNAELNAYLAQVEKDRHSYLMANDANYRASVEYNARAAASAHYSRGDSGYTPTTFGNRTWDIGGGQYMTTRTSASGDRVIETRWK